MTQRSLAMHIITALLLCLTGSFAWAAAPTSFALTVSLASPTAVGTPVLLTATPDTPGALEFKFRTKYTDATGSSVWTTVQEYSSKNTCTWTPPEAHVYTIVAYTRLKGTTIPYLLYRDQVITVKPAVTDIRVTLSLASPTAVGTSVKLSVTPVNGGTVEYRFRVKYQLPDTTYTWQTLQEYSVLSTCTWTPAEAHPYILYVYAREKGRSVTYTVFKEIPYTVKTPVSWLQLAASCPSPTGVGTPVKLTATATGGGTLEYKFYALYNDALAVQQTELIKEYSGSNVVTWSPKQATTYTTVVAQAREKGKTDSYDQQSSIINYVVVPAVTSLALATLPPQISAVGIPTTLIATPTGGGTLEYQFKAKYLSAPGVYAWLTLQEYGASNTCSWTPSVARSYSIIVYAREKGTTVAYKIYRELPYNVVQTLPAGTTSTNLKDNAPLVWVPGDTFTMGTEYDNWWAPATQQVTLSGYWIYKYDVTVAQYRAFCTATGHELPPWPGNNFSWTGSTGWDDPALQRHPIVNVTWYDAKDYADWAGVKLPTEAQWEYAARGPQGRNLPWGGIATAADPNNGWDSTKCANYYNSFLRGKSTWPVGSFPAGASWCGAQDMAGNVWQWCGDWYGEYSFTAVNNPTGPDLGTNRTMRSGSWGEDSGMRCAMRYSYDPASYIDSGVGFRCAITLPEP
ncbi:MAG: SUMF1/EgtB/PvdO family nonheme iron enzyme [bacterium]